MSYTLDFPIQYIPNPDRFATIGLGKLYIGVVDGDPAFEPADRVQVYIARQGDTDLAIPQPIALSAGGVPVYLGSPVTLKINQSFSCAVLDSSNQQICYSPKTGEIIDEINSLASIVDSFSDDALFFIENVAALSGYAPVVGKLYQLKEYNSGTGKGGSELLAKSGAIAPNNVTTFASATAGVYFERVNISRWADELSGGDLNLLFTHAPDGEVYITGESTPADITVTRNNLKIVGGNKPNLSPDGTRLENGAVIRGRLILGGNNCALINCGVDRGSYVTNTFFGGVAADALVVHDVGLTAQKTGNSLSDVIALIPNSVAFHACLYEKQEHGFLRNVRGIGGEWGVVIKGQHITFDGLSASNNTQGGVVIKSDSYAPCTDIVGTNVDTTGTTSGVGFYCYAATEQMQNIVVSNILTNGSGVGAKFVCSDRASYTYPMNDCTFDNIVTRNAVDFGVETFGALTNVNFGSVSSSDTVSGKSFRLDDNALDVHIESIKASAPAAMGSVPADAVYLAGRFFADKVQSVKGYDITSLQGVTIVPDATRLWGIGNLIGDCNLNKDASALLNGWTGAFGSVPRATLQSGKCVLSGRLAVPATPWAGKEVCYNVGVNMAPTVEKYFTTTGYDATAIKFVPIFVTVKTNGDVEVSQLTTASSFPATIAWIGFDLLEWDVSNLSV